MGLRFGVLSFLFVLTAWGQLIPAGMPVPPGPNPPIVFLNGYQLDCSNSTFAGHFGSFDQLFQATGRTSLFFDNCAFGKVSIEQLGNDFRDYLAGLKYTDGSAVSQVDVVAHSLGGLIVRSYLAGKQPASGLFQPPAQTGIRRMVFLAVPNFGTPIATLFGQDTQTMELEDGSLFSWDLGTWNQGTDDLRGVDTLAIVGNGGTGNAVVAGLDDGVVATTSGSIGFAEPGRTRVIPYCHTASSIIVFAGLCPFNAPAIAVGNSASDVNAALVLSFLNGTPAWQTLGQPAEQNPLLSMGGGLTARAKSSDDQYLTIQKATAQKATAGKVLNIQGGEVAWTAYLPAQAQDLLLTTPSGVLEGKFNLPAGFVSAITVKSGPFIARVYPAASAVTPLAIAPGELIAVYGQNLSGSAVSLAGTPAKVLASNDTQVNVLAPDTLSGFTPITVTNTAGMHSVNLLIQPSVPAIFTQDQAGSGPAAALNAITNALVTSTAPLRAGDYVALYLTGLGTTHTVNGLDYADLEPTVTVAGQTCAVTYAGRAPGFPGLDQIDCQIPASITASPSAPVVVLSAGRLSNIATLAIQ